VQRRHCVVAVILPAQERRELELPEIGLQALQGRGELALGLGIGALVEELVEDLDLLEPLGKRVVPLELLAEAGQPPGQVLGPGGVVPQAGLGDGSLELVGLAAASIDVKDTPSRSRPAPPGLGRGRCARSSDRMVRRFSRRP
jgi:hypothetical protein